MTALPQPDSLTENDSLERFQNVIEDYVSELGNLAAIAAIDVKDVGRFHFCAGYSNYEKTEPALISQLFQVGSQSKTFIAIVSLLLHRDGLLDLDTSVRTYVDLPIDRRITTRHLLMNTCGLGEMTFAMLPARYDPRIRLSPRDLVALALPQGQLFEPGSQFDYCNTGWAIAAMVIGVVADAPYQEVIRERVLEPWGLEDTCFGGHAPKERMLRGYLESPATSGLIDTSDALSWAFGAGDGISSLDDMLSLYGNLLRAKNPIGITLSDLNRVTAKPGPSPYFPLSLGTEYGLGVERRRWAGRVVWGHPGSTYSYLTGTWTDSERGVTVTTCVTRAVTLPTTPDSELRYPRAQLFAMALNTAYSLGKSAGSNRRNAS